MMKRSLFIAVVLMGASFCFGAGFIEELNSMGKGSLLDHATHTVVYKTVSGVELKLYVFVPENIKLEERRPAILFIHGGGWRQGDANALAEQAWYFCKRGMVTACCEYRLLMDDGVRLPELRKVTDSPADCLIDVKSAMRFFRSNAAKFQVDPDAIVSAGGSAGGHLALALATLDGFDDPADDRSVSCKPQAMMLFNPAYLWTARKADDAGMKKDSFAAARFVTNGIPPLVSFSGSEDGLSSPEINHKLVDAVKAAGSEACYFMYPGRAHGFYNRRRNTEDFKNVIFHCDRFLKQLGYLQGDPLIDDGGVAPETYGAPQGSLMCAAAPARELKKDSEGQRGN